MGWEEGRVQLTAKEEQLGRDIVASGRLKQLREELGLTRSAMAELLHTSPITYTSWEKKPEVNLWAETATRLGRFYSNSVAELDYVRSVLKIDMTDLVPLYIASTMMGISQELLLKQYRDEKFNAVDLGILGLWVEKKVLNVLRQGE